MRLEFLSQIYRIFLSGMQEKMSLSVKYGPGYFDRDQLQMLVSFHDIFKLMSLASDWLVFYLIFSYDMKQNFGISQTFD